MTNELLQLLAKRFPEREYALLYEVRNAAGYGASRSADAIAMCLWPSRGLEVNGIEIKVSRGDWLREMKKPEKAEAVFMYCDRWWLVTGDESVAKLEEIPPTWGWLTVKGSRLICKKEAPKLQPKEIGRDFMASLLKRATMGMVPRNSIAAEIDAAKDAGVKMGEARYESYKTHHMRELEQLRSDVATFEKASGVSLRDRWQLPVIGRAVKTAMEGINLEKRFRDLAKSIGLLNTAVIDAIERVNASTED